jgi:hypothetical protein
LAGISLPGIGRSFVVLLSIGIRNRAVFLRRMQTFFVTILDNNHHAHVHCSLNE